MLKIAQKTLENGCYPIGTIPPLGVVPEKMLAWIIEKNNHGLPIDAMKQAIIPIRSLKSDEVLICVLAAGINYNGVWAATGKPVSVFKYHDHDYHISGSDATGIIYAVGDNVRRWKVGDEIVVHCNQDDGDDEECNGGDPMYSPTQRIWGYETPEGAFSQFAIVQSRQLMHRPKHLSYEQSACYALTLATAYRMLFGHRPHILKPGHNVLIWGVTGGLGSMATQLVNVAGGNAIGVISDETKRPYAEMLGCRGVINRNDFDCWGRLPEICSDDYEAFLSEAKRFGTLIRSFTGGKDVEFVFEHPGEATFPLSTFVVKRGGMVVFCAGTTGYNLTFDARFVWIRQKRIQGSNFANLKQASDANSLVRDRRIDPCLSEAFLWQELPNAHTKMMNNEHKPGNMAVLVGASDFNIKTSGFA
jgi:crotonyl-CoA carboxylase/reductase